MKKLMIVIVVLLTIASEGFTQSTKPKPPTVTNPDTACIPVVDLLYKQRQADSLWVAKREIKDKDSLIKKQEQWLRDKQEAHDETKRELAYQEGLTNITEAKARTFQTKFLTADDRVKKLTVDVKVARRRTIGVGFLGIAATVATFFIASR